MRGRSTDTADVLVIVDLGGGLYVPQRLPGILVQNDDVVRFDLDSLQQLRDVYNLLTETLSFWLSA